MKASEVSKGIAEMSVDVRLPKKRKRISALAGLEPRHIVSPGDVITEDTGYMRLV